MGVLTTQSGSHGPYPASRRAWYKECMCFILGKEVNPWAMHVSLLSGTMRVGAFSRESEVVSDI